MRLWEKPEKKMDREEKWGKIPLVRIYPCRLTLTARPVSKS